MLYSLIAHTTFRLAALLVLVVEPIEHFPVEFW
jgi:hypothetical protein